MICSSERDNKLTFEVLPKTVQQTPTRHSVVEPDVCKENTLEKTFYHAVSVRAYSQMSPGSPLYSTVDAWIPPWSA